VVMSVGHRDVMLQLIREYQSLNSPHVEYRDSSPTPLEFSRILRSNRPVVFKSSILLHPNSNACRLNIALACIDQMAESRVPAERHGRSIDHGRGNSRRVRLARTLAYTSHADSIVNGHFVEPHQNTIPLSEMLTWLSSRKHGERKGPVRYVQSQNDNLSGEFERLQKDVSELDWANECIGIH